MTTHELKTWPEHFAAVCNKEKTAELRKDDRGFQVGDTLVLKEWNPDTQEYCGYQITLQVTHILRGGAWLTPGYCMLSFEPVTDE